jgi:twitching motility protein PilT
MIDHINTQHPRHIITVEDPIEFLFRDKRSVLNQRELGLDAMSFPRALRAALRQDPDVILVGELRDSESCALAIAAAEAGHLVLSTLSAADATSAAGRIVAMFPAHEQPQARRSLAGVLRGVISQRLLPRADGSGMVPALEVLVPSEQGLQPHEMMTLDRSLANLVKQRLVTYDEALAHAARPSDFALLFRGASGSPHPGWASGPTAVAVNPGAGHDEIEIENEGK